jgi:serine/threonine protein kinase
MAGMAEALRSNDPQQFGPYHLLARLGQGGMGTVYLGEDESGQKVAIKVINQELAGDAQFADRFRHEVQAARRVRRFCTAPVLDAALDAPPFYVVTEYIDGLTLHAAVHVSGPLRGSDLEGLAVGVATALSAIHDADLVHRDLKPANVLLSPFGPRVIDFGIARALDVRAGMTRTGQLVGTPAYIAPELVIGGAVTPAADVFSWGCVVSFAGTGRGPFEGTTIPEILHRVAYEPPDLDGLDPGLRELVEAALAKDPHDRPSVPSLLSELTGRRISQEPPPSAQPTAVAGNHRFPPHQFPSPSPAPRTLPISTPSYVPSHVPSHLPPRTQPSNGPYPVPQPPMPYRPPGRAGYPPGATGSGVGKPLKFLLGTTVLVVAVVAITLMASPRTGGSSPDGSTAGKATMGSAGRSSASPKLSGGVPAAFVGTWRGSIDQQGYANPYPVIVTITKGRLGEIVGHSSYPTLECSSSLTLNSASADRLIVQEQVTTGRINCTNTVITLNRNAGGTLDYSFKSPSGHGTLSH